ncbi:probable tubulin polyglutamylase TTLL2 [Panulirus ornatus]|uniref:probable tubulin polyglutamylase TTLL2 n=1 Tax=Panulirus ornatus TaxID=150431 RepID=UPI003A8920E9
MGHGEGEAYDDLPVRHVTGRVEGPIYYRVNDDNTGPELFMEVCVERGWRVWEGMVESDDWGSAGPSWHLWWRHGFPPAVYKKLRSHQVINHIPRANGLCKKDSLARALQKMKHVFGTTFDFMPATYLLPCEYTKLVAEYTRLMYHHNHNNNNKVAEHGVKSAPLTTTGQTGVLLGNQCWGQAPQDPPAHNIWICKPTGSSQGRGISIFQELHDLTYASSAVVQRYVHNPLLVGGYKCDVRLYVLVTSFLPLTVYMYTEGIVRFGTEKYCLTALDNVFSHLTNTSLNKLAPGYRAEKERVGAGCKWTVGELRRHLCGTGIRDWLLWHQVWLLVTLTLVSQVGLVPHHHNCFELYGFDILVDETLTPWLLEVNRCPSLSYDCDVDRVVKKPLLHHLFDLLGPPKVMEPLGRSLRPPVVVLLAHSDSAATEEEALSLRQYERLMDSLQRLRPTARARKVGTSTCQDRGQQAVVTPGQGRQSSLAVVRVGKREVARNSQVKSLMADGRKRPSVGGGKNELLLPEETFLPATTNTTFQRVRQQFANNMTTRSYLGRREGQEGVVEGGGPQRCPPRCGDWVRTFPYNAATLHASKDPYYTKTLVAEVNKVKRICEKVARENPTAPSDFLDSLLRKHLWRDSIIWRPKT